MLVFIFAYLLALGVADQKDVNDKHATNQKSVWRLYLDSRGRQMVMTTEKDGAIQDCYVSGDNYLIKSALQRIPQASVMVMSKRSMATLTNYCSYAKWTRKIAASDGEDVWQEFGVLSGMFIYPGTKWCGAGNVSENYDDLGPEVEADRCCRDHDHCNDSIEGFGSKYGLDNNAPYTKSHCSCDDNFFDCLRGANTRTSNRIGKIYFNYLQVQCFKMEHPIIGCNRYKGWFRPRCQEYELDDEQDPEWQMFDAKHYTSEGNEDKLITRTQDVFDYMLLTYFDHPKNSLNNKDLHSS